MGIRRSFLYWRLDPIKYLGKLAAPEDYQNIAVIRIKSTVPLILITLPRMITKDE
jgi:hypothetical protein